MSTSDRFPGSREEDAWLSDEQLERCAPAEKEPFQGPGADADDFQRRVHAAPTDARAEASGSARARSWPTRLLKNSASAGGSFSPAAAASRLPSSPLTRCSETSSSMSAAIEMFEPAAAAEIGPPKNLFVFDDQTHIVRSSTIRPRGCVRSPRAPVRLRRRRVSPPPPRRLSAIRSTAAAAIPPAWTNSAAPGHPGTRRNSVRISRRIPDRRRPCRGSFTWASTSTGCSCSPRPASRSLATRTSRCSRRRAEACRGRR